MLILRINTIFNINFTLQTLIVSMLLVIFTITIVDKFNWHAILLKMTIFIFTLFSLFFIEGSLQNTHIHFILLVLIWLVL